MERDLQSNL
jgi:hypothetical protein